MSSTTTSRFSPSGGNGNAGNNNERPRLTDAEKKQNHIISEQKRRQAIRQGFDRLACLTPNMNGMGRSEAAVLNAAVAEIKKQSRIKDLLKEKFKEKFPDCDDDDFERFYRTDAENAAVDAAKLAAAQAAASPAGSSTSSKSGKGKQVKKET